MRKNIVFLMLFSLMILNANIAHAGLSEATGTFAEGIMGYPINPAKAIGGALWIVGEIIAYPFKAFF